MVDPYLKTLQQNYYYLLSYPAMSDSSPMNVHETTSHDNSSRTTSNSQKSPPLSQKKCITVEDSMEVISKLISEIQSMDRLELEISSQPPSSSNPPPEEGFFHFSLAKKSCAVTNSTSSLPLLKKFFHCLLSTSLVHVLPVRNENQVPPIKLSSQVNDLTTIGTRMFFKASKPNSGSISGDLYVPSSLSFNKLSSFPKVSHWLQLHGCYMVLCDCQSYGLVRVGFLS